MSTVDDAVEAGAKKLWRAADVDGLGTFADHEWVMASALAVAWPILSAPLRELHATEPEPGGVLVCRACLTGTVCPTMLRIIETDRELGL